MGNYGNIPARPMISFKPQLHESETQTLQRIKQTPFTNSQVYTLSPPIFIENAQMSLAQLLQPRLLTKQLFPLPQIYKMIQNILTALLEVEKQGFSGHGEICADTIYYDAKSKNFKLIHPLLIPQSGYQLMRDQKRLSYLSPEQLLVLSEGLATNKNEMSSKSDIFSFGILICEVCSLLPSNQIYCPETFSIFDLEIQNRFNIIRDYYRDQEEEGGQKPKLINCLQDMVQYDEGLRKSAGELLRDYCFGSLQQKKVENRMQGNVEMKGSQKIYGNSSMGN